MSSKSFGRPKHGRKSTGDDDVSPGKDRSSKRRKTAHRDDGIAGVYAKKLQEAESALKRDMQAMEAELAKEEAIYAAAMERIVSVRRESAIWRGERMAQWDTTRRELMAQQQDAELAAELARVRMKQPQPTRPVDRQARVRERLKKRTAELKQAEAERAAKQQPEIIVEDGICYISDLDDEFMEALDGDTPVGSDSDDRDSLASADSISDDDLDRNIPMSPIGENIEVEQGDESDDDLEVDGLSNHSDYVTDDASHAPTSSTLDREASERRAREQAELLERQARARAEVEHAEAERARLRRERELRIKQEEARREQQERARREQQERSRQEQQERARQDYEQQQRRAAEAHRRSQPRRSLDPNSDAAAWARYTAQWNKLQSMGVPGKKNSDAILFFSNIPWPTVRAPRGPDDITKEAVASLVLSSSHSYDKTAKARLRELLLLWHPDKFVGRWMCYVVPADQPDVTEGVMAVARIANELMAERNLRLV
ncbi:unnamed protein product [Rhizoctonia solani]|uniref:Uncharacterized protein n=2 Tax=Rhizoctonia solani TaxID=456999 RepID=A0A8H3H507_9AGAM|nr:uncharacterized protein RhiXN_09277 [Rhizoctonia solani]KAF8685488.1 hypothetical protein RHS04_00572 [Rhizoctonia solani]QRW20302.1 hypothetical protein RhiXN_09277 [Rhizoctonia solani]CAE6485050.1 unnamed protein product [Rhizoctonia solani]